MSEIDNLSAGLECRDQEEMKTVKMPRNYFRQLGRKGVVGDEERETDWQLFRVGCLRLKSGFVDI